MECVIGDGWVVTVSIQTRIAWANRFVGMGGVNEDDESGHAGSSENTQAASTKIAPRDTRDSM